MFLNLFFLMACREKEINNEEPNLAPEITVTSHTSPVQLVSLYNEAFLATVSDEDNNFSDLMVSWYVDGEIVCEWQVVTPEGESLCEIRFNVGDQELVTKVRDLDNALGQAALALAISPNSPPEFQIQAPQNNEHFYLDQLVSFQAWIHDEEGDASTLTSSWTSSVDGNLQLNTTPDENGNISDDRYLSEGQHAITFEVEDETGMLSSQEIVITIDPANTPPTCIILEPLEDQLSLFGEPLVLNGTLIDQEWANDELSAIWSSSKDGLLDVQNPDINGAVGLEIDTLTTGQHYLSLEGTDEMGKSCTDSVRILVDDYPSATIDYPPDEAVFSIGEVISFQGTTLDGEDLEYVLNIEWTSSLDGMLESGNPNNQGTSSFTRNDLSPGVHEIIFTSTDTAALTTTNTIDIYINTAPEAPNLVLSPDPAFANVDLEVQASGSVDIDGDTIYYSYEWWVDGVPHSSTSSIIPASELDNGEVWTARVTPNDGHTDGAYTEASITISNSLPYFLEEASISPLTAYMNDTITCSAAAEDIDDGSLSIAYEWTNANGDILSSIDSYLILGTDAVVNETLTCSATAVDAQGATIISITTIDVSNTPPTIEAPIITSPTGPFFIDATLECVTTAEDPDQTLAIDYQWELNGSILSTIDTVDLSTHTVLPGDEVECIATTTDDEGEIATDSSIAVICYTTDCDQNLALGAGIGIDMKTIPAGSFAMGSPTTEAGRGTDEVQFSATLTQDFLLSTTEITQEAYESIHGTIWSESQTPMMGISETNPVYYVSWHMAASFANALTLLHNQTHNTALTTCYICQRGNPSATCSPVSNPYQCTGYRLPTEVEWEYASRSSSIASFWTQTGDEDIPSSNVGDCSSWNFAGGETLEDYAWFCSNNFADETQPVAEKTPNDFGLYDMHGNVAEWCHDWYQYYYPIGPLDDPVQLITTSDRVLRGGDWTDNPEDMRSGARSSAVPAYRFPTIGFRLARSAE